MNPELQYIADEIKRNPNNVAVYMKLWIFAGIVIGFFIGTLVTMVVALCIKYFL